MEDMGDMVVVKVMDIEERKEEDMMVVMIKGKVKDMKVMRGVMVEQMVFVCVYFMCVCVFHLLFIYIYLRFKSHILCDYDCREWRRIELLYKQPATPI